MEIEKRLEILESKVNEIVACLQDNEIKAKNDVDFIYPEETTEKKPEVAQEEELETILDDEDLEVDEIID